MPYVNPIPAIDIGKTFRMKLEMHFDEPIPVETARHKMAEYILQQDPATIASWITCEKISPMYPDDLTHEQRKKFGLLDKAVARPNEKEA